MIVSDQRVDLSGQRLWVERLYDLGHSVAWIASRTGVDLGRVNRILDRYAEQAGPLTPEQSAPVIEPLRGDVQTLPAKVIAAPKRKPAGPRGGIRKPREHGSMTGWRQHKAAGEPQCDTCTEASRAYFRENDHKKRAKASAAKDKVRVVYLAPPAQPGSTYTEYAVVDIDDRTRPVSARTAEVEAASGATVLARTVTPWRAVQIPTTEGATA